MKTLHAYLLLTLLSLALYLPGVFTIPVVDRDEAHFAQATKQMLETGNYFQVRFQDTTRFQKPPGINWLQAISVKAFSDVKAAAIWPYRIPSVFGGLFAVLLTFAFARRMCNDKIALLAASLLACTLLLTMEAHMALTDAMLLTAMVLMQGALGLTYLNSKQQTHYPPSKQWGLAILFWLAMSFGFALKGVTPLVGLLTIITLCCLDRNISWVKQLRPISGVILLIITSSWLYFVNQAEQSNYLGQMIAKDLLPKLIGGHESHGAPPGYHLLLSPITLWPVSIFLWQAIVWGWNHKKQSVEKFLIAWIVPTWIFFELMPTKLPQYILPTFPAICILAAFAILQANSMKFKGKHLMFLRVLYLVWGLISFVLAGVIFIIPYLMNKTITPLAILVLFIMSTGTIVAIIYSYKERFTKAAITLIVCAIFSYGPVFQVILPAIKPIWVSDQIKLALDRYAPKALTANTPLYVNNYREPSLTFLLGTHHVKFVSINSLAVNLQRKNSKLPATLALLDQSQLNELKQKINDNNLTVKLLTEINGYNYNKGKQIKLFLISVQYQN